jgi:6-phosphogluconolactonase
MIKKMMAMCAMTMMLGSCQTGEKALTMLVGTYTDTGSEGVLAYSFDQTTGEAEKLGSVKVSNPSYLTISKDGKHFYSVSENAEENAKVNSFSLGDDGKMSLLNSVEAKGGDPCYITCNEKWVFAANYSGGSIAAFAIKKDGRVGTASQLVKFNSSGPDTARQKTAHLHCVRITPDGKYLFADDLGGDCIYRFKIVDGEKPLTAMEPKAVKLAAGCGPRHLEFAPDGKHAYLVTELSGEVMTFNYEAAKGELTQIQTVSTDSVDGRGSADIHISPDGKYLYASNRLKADGISIFAIGNDGKIVKTGYQLTGTHPRNFAITPNGKYLLVACRDSNMIQVLTRDEETGLLSDTGKNIELKKPVCVKFK